MNESKTALLAGATGAIGQQLLPLLLASPDYGRVKVIGRRPPAQAHAKLEAVISDFSDLKALGSQLAADDVYCCLGTTQGKSGRAGLEQVDHDYVVALAAAALAQGARQFLVVSAIGASSHSPSFYSRVKGRMEEDVAALGYPSLRIVQPSLLLGPREEHRPGEAFAQKLSPLLSPLLAGPLAKYRPISTQAVAAALLTLSRRPYQGTRVHTLPLRG
ncbi:NAD(P)H-binding protein [Solimonas sp. SE-A11]|uniref:NAD(P)H-binding protein n=1 Tax=Solimonas sp. SE-A11 TaxID=3054954 RepID=UPI00259D1B6A|nr:NAD(P)H-binding protein [Solimonas sp. SE-A11]